MAVSRAGVLINAPKVLVGKGTSTTTKRSNPFASIRLTLVPLSILKILWCAIHINSKEAKLLK